jgi:hypothetical protein
LASAKRLDCLRILSEKHGQLAADLGQRLADLVRWIWTSWRRI